MYENHKEGGKRRRKNTRVKIYTRVFVEQHDVDIWWVINHVVNQKDMRIAVPTTTYPGYFYEVFLEGRSSFKEVQ